MLGIEGRLGERAGIHICLSIPPKYSVAHTIGRGGNLYCLYMGHDLTLQSGQHRAAPVRHLVRQHHSAAPQMLSSLPSRSRSQLPSLAANTPAFG